MGCLVGHGSNSLRLELCVLRWALARVCAGRPSAEPVGSTQRESRLVEGSKGAFVWHPFGCDPFGRMINAFSLHLLPIHSSYVQGLRALSEERQGHTRQGLEHDMGQG